jgi:hypothetical protein
MKKLMFVVLLVALAIPSLAAADTFSLSGGAWPSGVTVVATNPFAGFTSGCCAFAGQTVWHDVLVPNGYTTTLTFATALTSFGGLWDLAGPGGPGTGINVYFDGVFAGLIDHNTAGTFVGFSSLTPFTTVLLKADGQAGVAETYELASFTITKAPEPSTMVLLGSGALLALFRRLRKNQG